MAHESKDGDEVFTILEKIECLLHLQEMRRRITYYAIMSSWKEALWIVMWVYLSY